MARRARLIAQFPQVELRFQPLGQEDDTIGDHRSWVFVQPLDYVIANKQAFQEMKSRVLTHANSSTPRCDPRHERWRSTTLLPKET